MFQLLLVIIYLSFISLGLPDSLLGAAWPSMYGGFSVPVSYAGIVSMIIAASTVVSSLLADRMIKKLGTGRLTAFSVLTTAAALFGFSTCTRFWQLCVWAVPYGLGAGSVDSGLNNYVALHYESRHMSWLHCMWGVGATVGPAVMGAALTGGRGWQFGYREISVMQLVLTAVLMFSLPLWRKNGSDGKAQAEADRRVLSLKEIIGITGVPYVMLCFFCYCGVEQTAGLWASSYLTLTRGFAPETAASFASMVFIGITVGRALSGFAAMKLNDRQMVRLGAAVIALGVLALLIPGQVSASAAFVLIGLGCAPIYPSLIHATPAHFGAEHSQAVIGIQMASAYVGTCLLPPLFGFLAGKTTQKLLPVYLAALLILMFYAHARLERVIDRANGKEKGERNA